MGKKLLRMGFSMEDAEKETEFDAQPGPNWLNSMDEMNNFVNEQIEEDFEKCNCDDLLCECDARLCDESEEYREPPTT